MKYGCDKQCSETRDARGPDVFGKVESRTNESQSDHAAAAFPLYYAAHIHTPNTAIMSLTNCRFYEEKYPDVDSLVMVNVRQVAEMGA